MVEIATHNNYTLLIDSQSKLAIKFSTYQCPGARITFVPEILPGETLKIELLNDPLYGEVLSPDLKAGRHRIIQSPPAVYGFITCTLSSKNVTDPWIGLPGDGDCLDAILITDKVCIRGLPIQCRAIGAWMCADGGESDWKIALTDAAPDETIQDIDTKIDEGTKWLETYKPNCLQVIKYVRDPNIVTKIISHHCTIDRRVDHQKAVP